MKQTHESAPLLRMAAWACGPTGLVSILTIFYHPPSLPSIPCPSGQPPDWCGWGRGSGGAGLIPSCSTPCIELPDGTGGLWEDWGCLCPTTPCALPRVQASPLLCVFPSLSMVHPVPPGECVTALTGTHTAGELSPGTLPWEMPFSLLTLNFRARSGHSLVTGLCPGTRVVRMGSFPFAAVPFACLPSLPCFHLFSFFPSSGGLFPFLVNPVCSHAR